jgi:ethanolamine-phosphate cytidylyltransferase
VTLLPWVSHYGCRFVGHGDDVTSDGAGEDCYRFVKRAGRFKVFRRTPGISTTDLVGRMLLCSRAHFVRSLADLLAGREGEGPEEDRRRDGEEMFARLRDYATDASGLRPGSEVWSWTPAATDGGAGAASLMVAGKPPRPGQRVVYVDGGFDLFSSGHIEFLRCVQRAEDALGRARGWFEPSAVAARTEAHGEDYPPAYVLAGVHDDLVINRAKGVNYPIMNVFERGLCVLQCRFVHAVVFSAPFVPAAAYLRALPHGPPAAVYHGPTAFMPLEEDPYVDAKRLGIFRQVETHDFAHVNAGEIVQRILSCRAMYEERQRVKAAKSAVEEAAKKKQLEQKA